MPFGVRSALRLAPARSDQAIVGKEDYHSAVGIAATPSIFRTLSVPILRGRGFDERDHFDAERVVVLSEFTARKIFGTADVVGQYLIVRSQPSQATRATVIGIAGNTDVGHVLGDPRAFVYVPLAQRYEPFLAVAARATGNATSAARALRDAFRRTDPDLAVDVIGTGRRIERFRVSVRVAYT